MDKWIPVSESLPEKNVWVLVTVEQSGNRHQEIMRRNNYFEAWTDNIDNYTDEITAWMPLPKPYEPTCDTCKYTTAAFNPCNACKDKSEYEPQEISDRNLKMWEEIFKAESEDKE